MPGISNVKVIPAGVIKNGSVIKVFTRGKEVTSTITGFSKNSLVTMTSVQGQVLADYIYTFVSEGEFTGLSLLAKVEAKGFTKVLLPIIKIAIKRADSGQLVKFNEAFVQNK